MHRDSPDLEGSDGRVRHEHHVWTRRPRQERYFNVAPVEELPREWLISVVGMIEVVLDSPGTITLQDIVDSIDYGPHQLAPRQRRQVQKLAEAFERSMSKQAEKCARGEHMMKNGRCWVCKESTLKIVEDDS